jgi:hypothetical protein
MMASLGMDFAWRAMCAELATRAILLDALGFGRFQAAVGATGRGQNGWVGLQKAARDGSAGLKAAAIWSNDARRHLWAKVW